MFYLGFCLYLYVEKLIQSSSILNMGERNLNKTHFRNFVYNKKSPTLVRLKYTLAEHLALLMFPLSMSSILDMPNQECPLGKHI